MSLENFNSSVNEAMSHIHALRYKFQSEGNVDSENDVLNSLLNQLQSGRITPLEAIKQANSINDSRIER